MCLCVHRDWGKATVASSITLYLIPFDVVSLSLSLDLELMLFWLECHPSSDPSLGQGSIQIYLDPIYLVHEWWNSSLYNKDS